MREAQAAAVSAWYDRTRAATTCPLSQLSPLGPGHILAVCTHRTMVDWRAQLLAACPAVITTIVDTCADAAMSHAKAMHADPGQLTECQQA